ncbi:MAG: TatD family hydrolase [Rickettsiaceae bacterium]
MLVDSHCHLDMLLKDSRNTLSAIIKRSSDAGVKYLHTICTKIENFHNILSIAKQYDNIYASVGVHPNEVKNDIVQGSYLIKLSKDDNVIAFGETGLDYYYERSDKEKQKQSFNEHIAAAQSEQLPVIVHTRDADSDTASLISSAMQYKSFPALIHCFSSSKKFAREMLDLGLYISISGIVTFKNAHMLQEIVKFLPLDRLLIETDAPYLAPMPHRGKTNDPAFVVHTASKIAELHNTSFEQIANITTQNFFNLFSKANKILNSNN